MEAGKPRLLSLEAIRAVCWRELERAAADAAHDWRVMALATADAAGVGDARCVVVREASSAERTLMFYTDERSPKVARIREQPQATLLAWSRTLGWQLRIRARLTVETSGLKTSSRWARMKMTPGAQDYLSPIPPGARLGQPVPPDRGTRDHFAVVTVQVEAIDWTELHAEGHRRALFGPDGADWLQP
jgi:hypothetical protein